MAKKSRRTKSQKQKHIEYEARRRERHMKLVNDRARDKRYVQKSVNSDGSKTYSLSEDARDALVRQRERFIEKFGREPGPDDPVFFEDDADVPQAHRGFSDEEWAELEVSVAAAGVDPAYIRAFRELGYIITTENEHLFSHREVEAFFDAVGRHGE